MRRLTSSIGILVALLSLGTPVLAREKAQTSALTIHADQENGHDAVHVYGHGPVLTSIKLFTEGWISRDLPAVPLGSGSGYQYVQTDATGKFSTEVSLATDNFPGSLVTIDASVPDQHLHASADFHLGSPSPNVNFKYGDTVPSK